MTVRPVVTLWKAYPPATAIDLPLDEAVIGYDGGIGGWEMVARPLRVNATDWVGGYDPHRLTIPVLKDHWPHGDCESWLRKLQWFAERPVGKSEPATVRLFGFMADKRKWVIESITYGDSLRNPETGHRARVQLTVGLLEFVKADIISKSPARKTASKRATVRRTTIREAHTLPVPGRSEVRIHVAETLSDVAARTLSDATRWPEIAQLNNLAGPRSTYVGQVVEVPAE